MYFQTPRTHVPPQADGSPTVDQRPGHYYVSAIDGPRSALVSGPYPTHQQALDLVPAKRAEAEKLDPKAVFYAFGTCRWYGEGTPPIGALERARQPDPTEGNKA